MPSRSEVLMIGDSLSSDIAGGIGYGLDTCWYNPHGLPGRADLAPTYEIRDLAELLPLLS
jgi:2-haloacid dehalogenase